MTPEQRLLKGRDCGFHGTLYVDQPRLKRDTAKNVNRTYHMLYGCGSKSLAQLLAKENGDETSWWCANCQTWIQTSALDDHTCS
jgi:hypothetical protein